MRHNETTRVAAVLSHLDDGNRQAAIDALMLLWLEDPERPDAIDGAAIDAWHAIERAGALDDAVAATLTRVRAGNRIRRHAFIELTERVSDLIELAELVLEYRWSADPYLAAVLLRLAERAQGTLFLELVERHRERFESDTALWELVLFVMSTSRIGDGATIAKWFESWVERKPRMWMVSAYAGSLFQGVTELDSKSLHKLVELSTAVCERLPWDDSAAVFVCFKMIGDLKHDRVAEFEATLEAHRDLITTAIQSSRLHHPIVRFANGLKHAHPVVGAQLDEPRKRLQTAPHETVINRQLAYVVFDLTTAVSSMLEALELYGKLQRTPRGDRRLPELARTMDLLDRGGAGGWIRMAWFRLFRQRCTWLQRLRFLA